MLTVRVSDDLSPDIVSDRAQFITSNASATGQLGSVSSYDIKDPSVNTFPSSSHPNAISPTSVSGASSNIFRHSSPNHNTRMNQKYAFSSRVKQSLTSESLKENTFFSSNNSVQSLPLTSSNDVSDLLDDVDDSLARSPSVKSLVQFYSAKNPNGDSGKVPSGSASRKSSVTTDPPQNRVFKRETPTVSSIEKNSEIAKRYAEAARARAAENAKRLLEEKQKGEERLQEMRRAMQEERKQKKMENMYARSILGDDGSLTGLDKINLSSPKATNTNSKLATMIPRGNSTTQSVRQGRTNSSVASRPRSRGSSISSISSFTVADGARLSKERLQSSVMQAREKLAKQRELQHQRELEKARIEVANQQKEKEKAKQREADRLARERRTISEKARIERERRFSMASDTSNVSYVSTTSMVSRRTIATKSSATDRDGNKQTQLDAVTKNKVEKRGPDTQRWQQMVLRRQDAAAQAKNKSDELVKSLQTLKSVRESD